MNTVRDMAKTTVTLMVFIGVVILFALRCANLPMDFFHKINMLLRSRSLLGPVHNLILGASFWCLLLVSGLDAVYHEKTGLEIVGAFSIPLLFSLCVAAWGYGSLSAHMDIRWFWLFYYVVLIVCLKVSLTKLTRVRGAGSSRIALFFKDLTAPNDTDVSDLDFYVVRVAKVVLLAVWLILLVAAAAYCVQNRSLFLSVFR